ncbi:hypothetical protein KQX54_011634 [Cotesia glomerata]|uniref:Integrase catalytic domain-containing protein n=1 Tax=Cotesia glomerata TaxID=32391 RepID=A0AAV7I8X3_COTGL|nr:hypothetical protein KQX54_011634 [Cotesia glomerata]
MHTTIQLNTNKVYGGKATFLIDTGAEINLIRENVREARVEIDESRKTRLHRITSEAVITLGKVEFDIEGRKTIFDVVGDQFNLEEDGILGLTFLEDHGVKINFEDRKITFGINTFDFCKDTIEIPERSIQMVHIRVVNAGEEGYVPRCDIAPGVYLGDAVVSVINGRACMYVYNITEEKHLFTVPYLEMDEFEEITADAAIYSIQKDETTGNSRHERANKILATISTEHLDKEELEIQEAGDVAKALAEKVICLFGAPQAILTDKGAKFMSETMRVDTLETTQKLARDNLEKAKRKSKGYYDRATKEKVFEVDKSKPIKERKIKRTSRGHQDHKQKYDYGNHGRGYKGNRRHNSTPRAWKRPRME